MTLLRYYPDPILQYESSPISKFDEKLEDLANRMFDVMYESDGVGLAAPQIGHSLRVFVYDDYEGHNGAIVNPHLSLVKKGPVEVETSLEGCLSIPTAFMDVPRYASIWVRGQDIFGNKAGFKAEHLLAHIVQHEHDHLQGILITEVTEKWQILD